MSAVYSPAELKVWFQLHSSIMLANQISSGKTAVGLPYPVGAAEVAKQKLREALAVAEGSEIMHPLITIIAAAIIVDLDKIILEQKL